MNRIIQASESEFLSLVEQAVRNVLKDYQPASTTDQPQPPATKKEAANYLGVSMPTLDALMRSGELKFFNIGRSVRLRWADIDAYINQKGA
jgi:excisionase family DNA binding protein